ncbi:MAG TPA: hypothetical protein VFO73_14200 [Candidatus Limnocylindrales bacterium]|nr:hypothetical protein [Candidatus Limnocylindrales bacterium]
MDLESRCQVQRANRDADAHHVVDRGAVLFMGKEPAQSAAGIEQPGEVA